MRFYEKLTTNPLGDVRDGLYDWITGQTANGGMLTITEDGDVLGYKSVQASRPEWRTGVSTVYRPSWRGAGTVNGIDVPSDKYIEQAPGDVVEMPRSKVLHAPSRACGDGLHIGTYDYAERYVGDTVMLVQFSPRDIVSLPDSNSTWKLRVCRYTVIGPVTEPLDVPVYMTAAESGGCDQDDGELVFGGNFEVGDRVEDCDGDEGEVVGFDSDGDPRVKYDDMTFGTVGVEGAELVNLTRQHGKGGPTSQEAKGRGRNPAQDALGRFSAGRPGSQRSASTGRFA